MTASHSSSVSPEFSSNRTASPVPSKSRTASNLKPLHAGKSGVDVNSGIHDQTPPPTPHGLRAQLNHLLPRHAYFLARVEIHQISSVPFVSGEFGVRWKFKGVHSPPGTRHGFLGIGKPKPSSSSSTDLKGKGREGVGHHADDASSSSLPPATMPRALSDSHGSARTVVAPSFKRQFSGQSTSSSSSGVPAMSSMSSKSSTIYTNTLNSSQPSSYSTPAYAYTQANLTITHVTPSSSSPAPSPSIPATLSPARGKTLFLPLKDHAVSWSQTLSTVLRFDVERDTSSLLASPFKLVVMQRVIPDDPNGVPQNPRLGAVYLNLAEYVGQGSVDRRYLLRESKTNATLKLTISLEHVGGDTHYIPPPLPKGEILTGIAGFLDNDIFNKRPRALHPYGPYRDQEELEIDLLGATRSHRNQRRKASDGNESDTDDSEEESAFDVQRLPVAYGPKTTEALIEALFNPVKTTERRKESPFTYYVPPSQNRAKSGGSAGSRGPRTTGLGIENTSTDEDNTIGRRHPSLQDNSGRRSETDVEVYSTGSSSASVRTPSDQGSMSGVSSMHSMSSHGHGRGLEAKGGDPGGVRGWWRKVSARPVTPTPRI